MKVYLVGGAVRDEIMGIEPKDKDYVVVGATPAEMFNKGFKQVGADFPVFLHPETGDEYALARTERKNGEGYQAFDCYFGTDVTLMDDLRRRDLTINAIAKDMETGSTSITSVVSQISVMVFCVKFPSISMKIHYGYCGWQDSWPASRNSKWLRPYT